jgi:hypothetical protein
MNEGKKRKQSRPKRDQVANKPSDASPTSVTPAPQSSTPSQAGKQPVDRPDDLWERIAKKAYELWEQRGRREGHALEDWLDAEAMVLNELHETRE